MTPDELRARCDQALEHLENAAVVRYYSIDPTVELGENAYLVLESLCREMIAEGLERAAIEFERRKVDIPQSIMEKMYRKWCRQEAKRVKDSEWIG